MDDQRVDREGSDDVTKRPASILGVIVGGVLGMAIVSYLKGYLGLGGIIGGVGAIIAVVIWHFQKAKEN
jgi:hypothetical protein